MKKRTLGILAVMALATVLALGLAAPALAAPSFTTVDPTSWSNGNGNDFDLIVHGSHLGDIVGGLDVYLVRHNAPFNVIDAWGEHINWGVMPPIVDCTLNVGNELAGKYDVVIEYYTMPGQTIPDSQTLPNAFEVTTAPPPPPPQHIWISGINPWAATAGGPGFDLIVMGGGFDTNGDYYHHNWWGATVYWNNVALATQGVWPNPDCVLKAAVPASLIATPGTALITVVNPGWYGQQSNSVPFVVYPVAMTLTSLSPTSTWAKCINPPLVTLTGTNFPSSAQVLVNGTVHTSTFVSATQLTVQLTAADIAAPATLNFAVRNGATGTPTTALPLTVAADTTTPVTTISGADSAWHNMPVTLTVSVADPSGPGVQKTQWGIAAAGGTPVWNTLSGTTITVPAPAGGAGDGAQLIQAYSTDNCGNVETPPKSVTVYICTVGPKTTGDAPDSVKKGNSLKLTYEADSITPTCAIKLVIYDASGAIAKTMNLGSQSSNSMHKYYFTCRLPKGKYQFKVNATDAAGNPQSSQIGDWFKVK